MKELEIEMESIRERLNELIAINGGVYRNEEIINVSIKLNFLINQYYKIHKH